MSDSPYFNPPEESAAKTHGHTSIPVPTPEEEPLLTKEPVKQDPAPRKSDTQGEREFFESEPDVEKMTASPLRRYAVWLRDRLRETTRRMEFSVKELKRARAESEELRLTSGREMAEALKGRLEDLDAADLPTSELRYLMLKNDQALHSAEPGSPAFDRAMKRAQDMRKQWLAESGGSDSAPAGKRRRSVALDVSKLSADKVVR